MSLSGFPSNTCSLGWLRRSTRAYPRRMSAVWPDRPAKLNLPRTIANSPGSLTGPHSLADLMSNFSLIGADRFNVLLLKHDVRGTHRNIKDGLLRRWDTMKDAEAIALAVRDWTVIGSVGNPRPGSRRSGCGCGILPAANLRLVLQPRRNLCASSFTHRKTRARTHQETSDYCAQVELFSAYFAHAQWYASYRQRSYVKYRSGVLYLARV